MTTTQRGNKSTIVVDDTQVEMFSGGSGPALVFLHGAGGNAGWQDWHEELAKDYTVYAPSQPGFNGTAHPEWVYTITDVAHFNQAMEIWNEVAPGPAYKAESGHVLDGGFENNLAHGSGAVFGWQVQSNSQVQIGIDAGQGHSGGRSLRVFFQVRSHIDTINVSQLVPVKPNTEYELECYVKTERVESAETPVVLVVNAADDAVLVGSPGAPSGSTGWQRVSLPFKTGEATEAVKVKMVRNSCPDSPVCPIFGTVWYDDFDLKPRK